MAGKKVSLQDKVFSFFKIDESAFSTILGALVVIIIGILVYNYFKSAKPQITQDAEETQVATESGVVQVTLNEKGEEVPVNLPATYNVAEGDMLWSIAQKNYGSGFNWVDIAEANGLSTPDTLLVDQKLIIPQVAVRKPIAEVKEALFEPTIDGDSYTVQKGDYLSKVAFMAYGDGYQWTKIAEANNISLDTANYIEIGQELKIPR